MELTIKERLSISYQLKILEKLYPEEAQYYALNRKAIEEGYELHYEWIVQHLSDGLTKSECQEVIQILEMYRGIIFSFNALTEKNSLTLEKVRFQGFDGNNETSYMTYTEFFVIDQDRYREIKESNGGNFNSHYPMLNIYRKRLKKWNAIEHESRYSMSYLQIEEIIETL